MRRAKLPFVLLTTAAACSSNGDRCDDMADPCAAADCAHGLCSEGAALDASCQDLNLPGDCAAQVCAADAFCCDTNWNEFCVEKAVTVCGLTCQVDAHCCCRTCGPNSKACGDRRIPNANPLQPARRPPLRRIAWLPGSFRTKLWCDKRDTIRVDTLVPIADRYAQ